MTDSNTHAPGEIQDQMARGAVWMIMLRWSMRGLGFLNVIILARILTPEDFGLVAMAMILIGLITTLTEGNFDHSLLRKANTPESDYHAAWTLQILAGLLATCIIYLLSPLIVAYFDDQRLYLVCFIAGLKPAIHGFENIGQAEFRREFNFRKEFRYWMYRQVITVAIGLSLALTLRNYLALAIVMPLASLAIVALSFRMSTFRPKFQTKGMWHILSFSKWYALLDTTRFTGDKADEFIIGGITSPVTLGHYYMASDIATMPTREVTMPLDRALIPTLAHISHDTAQMQDAFAKSFAAVLTMCMSVGFGLYMISYDFVVVVLGDQWLPAIPFFEWLAIYGLFSALTISTQSFFVTSENLKTYALCYIAYMISLIAALIVVANEIGITGIAPARTFWMMGLTSLILGFAVRLKLTTLRDLTRASWRPLTATLLMLIGLTLFQSILTTHTAFTLGAQIVVGASLFMSASYFLWLASGRPEGIETSSISFIEKRLTRFRAS